MELKIALITGIFEANPSAKFGPVGRSGVMGGPILSVSYTIREENSGNIGEIRVRITASKLGSLGDDSAHSFDKFNL